MKCQSIFQTFLPVQRRPPHGGCGLKSTAFYRLPTLAQSSPSPRRVWIEILMLKHFDSLCKGRPPHGGCGLKSYQAVFLGYNKGRPPHGGCGLKCDRRFAAAARRRRPPHGGRGLKFSECGGKTRGGEPSPSPRRAWIEMLYRVKKVAFISVSPSPRRAWIEIMSCALHSCTMLSPSTRKAQSETGGYIKYIRKHDNCLFIVLEQRFLNIETAPCSQIQDAAIIGLQYSKTSMLYARQLTIYIPCLRSSIFCA